MNRRGDTRVLGTPPSLEQSSVLAAFSRSSAPRSGTRPHASASGSSSDVFRYCHAPGHFIDACPKLAKKRRRPQQTRQATAAVATPTDIATPSASSASDSTIAQLTERLEQMQLQQVIQAMTSTTSSPAEASAFSASALSASSGISGSTWLLDSGASHHMTSDASLLVDCTSSPPPFLIRLCSVPL